MAWHEGHHRRLEQLRTLRLRYMEWHDTGMDALRRRDLTTLSAAIRAEKEILEQQELLIAALRDEWKSDPD